MRIAIVSHCGIEGNSGIHVAALARAFTMESGFHTLILVPEPSDADEALIADRIEVAQYGEALGSEAVAAFAPDLLYAFTPRDHVARFTQRVAQEQECPYVVHLEDDEVAIALSDAHTSDFDLLARMPNKLLRQRLPGWRIHPRRYRRFLDEAVGVTGLVGELRTNVAEATPWFQFYPGAQDAFFREIPREEAREALGLQTTGFLIPYTGSVHDVSLSDFMGLLLSVQLLRDFGLDVSLVKTGKDSIDWRSLMPAANEFVIDLGFRGREDVRRAIAAADVLVQTGRDIGFNRRRFPSKLPEYFAMRRPVVMSRVFGNGLIESGIHAVLIDGDSPMEYALAVQRLLENPGLADHIANGGRRLAETSFRWGPTCADLAKWLEELVASRDLAPMVRCDPRMSSMSHEPALIAFYLPQFHPIPENDEWWGQGFTEWTSVNSAVPQFDGHTHPRRPHPTVGQYDLRDPAVLVGQAEMARRYGISAFCYYYYWFDGRRLLEGPLEAMRESRQLNFPYMICWANENWTRRWDGRNEDVLMQQTYAEGWEEAWFEDAALHFDDPRYLRMDGAPMVMIYNLAEVPELRGALVKWKEMARRRGFVGLYVMGVQHIGMPPEWPLEAGCDASVEFPPHLGPEERRLLDRLHVPTISPKFTGYLERYEDVTAAFMRRRSSLGPWYRGVMPSWDNTARRGRQSHIYLGATPKKYGAWLADAYDYAATSPDSGPLVFINAWNEWAEGAVLEPDEEVGFAYLEETARVVLGYVPSPPHGSVTNSNE